MKAIFAVTIVATAISLRFNAVTNATPQETRKPEDRQVAVYSLGQESCGLWLDAYAKRNTGRDIRLVQFESYLEGFATAYNIYGPDTGGTQNHILSTDVYAQRAFLERYCREHPIDSYLNAINALFRELRKKS